MLTQNPNRLTGLIYYGKTWAASLLVRLLLSYFFFLIPFLTFWLCRLRALEQPRELPTARKKMLSLVLLFSLLLLLLFLLLLLLLFTAVITAVVSSFNLHPIFSITVWETKWRKKGWIRFVCLEQKNISIVSRLSMRDRRFRWCGVPDIHFRSISSFFISSSWFLWVAGSVPVRAEQQVFVCSQLGYRFFKDWS